jgi:excisionase family DNA binding protein
MSRNHFTTNDIAQICSVTRQTVINWIKGGKLKAVLTPGGHRRVSRGELVRFLRGKDLDPVVIAEFEEQRRKEVPYCWEYFGVGFTKRFSSHQCDSCAVKEVRALRCYLLKSLLNAGKESCNMSCQDCPYLRRYSQALQEGGL